jgi:hypothetical protein
VGILFLNLKIAQQKAEIALQTAENHRKPEKSMIFSCFSCIFMLFSYFLIMLSRLFVGRFSNLKKGFPLNEQFSIRIWALNTAQTQPEKP